MLKENILKKKFIIIGTGNRGLGCFAKGLLSFPNKGRPEFKEHADIVALVDTNLTRGRAAAKEIGKPDLPVFATIEEAKSLKADWCIVTTPDRTHGDTVCRALKTGLNVFVDKPLATSSQECQNIIDASKATGKQVIVGHNMRYSSHLLDIKKKIKAGLLGDIISVESAEVLDNNHGGDYFHRWHSDFKNSAGMMTHKGCHFIDILNWLLGDEPIRVQASGGRSFYKPRPELNHGERCLDCNIKKDCLHYFDMDKWDGVYRRIYKEAEVDDGYVRDLCVFSDRHTINDHENLIIEYKKGTKVNFSLITFGPKSSVYFYFNGSKGRVEIGTDMLGQEFCRIIWANKTVENIPMQKGEGEHGHGGADVRLMGHILGIDLLDPLYQANPIEAKMAVDVADMAARSIAKNGVPVSISEVGKDFPPAPPKRK
jgi:predicted dehydrogenase